MRRRFLPITFALFSTLVLVTAAPTSISPQFPLDCSDAAEYDNSLHGTFLRYGWKPEKPSDLANEDGSNGGDDERSNDFDVGDQYRESFRLRNKNQGGHQQRIQRRQPPPQTPSQTSPDSPQLSGKKKRRSREEVTPDYANRKANNEIARRVELRDAGLIQEQLPQLLPQSLSHHNSGFPSGYTPHTAPPYRPAPPPVQHPGQRYRRIAAKPDTDSSTSPAQLADQNENLALNAQEAAKGSEFVAQTDKNDLQHLPRRRRRLSEVNPSSSANAEERDAKRINRGNDVLNGSQQPQAPAQPLYPQYSEQLSQSPTPTPPDWDEWHRWLAKHNPK